MTSTITAHNRPQQRPEGASLPNVNGQGVRRLTRASPSQSNVGVALRNGSPRSVPEPLSHLRSQVPLPSTSTTSSPPGAEVLHADVSQSFRAARAGQPCSSARAFSSCVTVTVPAPGRGCALPHSLNTGHDTGWESLCPRGPARALGARIGGRAGAVRDRCVVRVRPRPHFRRSGGQRDPRRRRTPGPDQDLVRPAAVGHGAGRRRRVLREGAT